MSFSGAPRFNELYHIIDSPVVGNIDLILLGQLVLCDLIAISCPLRITISVERRLYDISALVRPKNKPL
jgi:hypothetical protein